MAAKKTNSDTIQIVLMTFYLMALFFGCWGAWNHIYQDREEIVARNKEDRNLDRLKVLLKDRKSKETLLNFRRLTKSRDNQGVLSDEVYEVARSIPGLTAKIDNSDDRPGSPQSGGMVEMKAIFDFMPMTLDSGLLHFMSAVEARLPHCNFSKVQLIRKMRGEDEDLWDGEMHIVTYRAKKN